MKRPTTIRAADLFCGAGGASAGLQAACRALGDAAAADYRDALSRGASLREVSSIREHLEFLSELTQDWPEAVGQALDAAAAVL